ncbi:hypothetical protein [Ornithinibacillus xuwenensis]|uniref:ABC transporter permease n=1 Tax=Ornithinibacillus xuwenensis TaxID=3144668 RepID=A0ABU9XJZ7_9BACI
MKRGNEAVRLAAYEIRRSYVTMIMTYLVAAIFLANLIIHFSSYMENGTTLYDFLFITLFAIQPLVPKAKGFEIEVLQEGFMAAPIVMMQKQLPIHHETIIKSRLFVHFFYSFPIHLILLIALYLATSLHDILSIGSFVALCTIWLSYSICCGLIIPRISIGIKGFIATNYGITIIVIMLAPVLLMGLTFVHVFFDNGIVYWSFVLAEQWPVLSIVLSIFIGAIGYFFWIRKMRKAILIHHA